MVFPVVRHCLHCRLVPFYCVANFLILAGFISTATSFSVRKLPPPDYLDGADDDRTLRVPVVIDYDKWRQNDAGCPSGRL